MSNIEKEWNPSSFFSPSRPTSLRATKVQKKGEGGEKTQRGKMETQEISFTQLMQEPAAFHKSMPLLLEYGKQSRYFFIVYKIRL